MKEIFRFVLACSIATQIPIVGATSSFAQSTNQPTSFECRTDDSIHYTIAMGSDDAVSEPIIVWTSDAFTASGYPPERRCNDVSDRLNSLLSENGNSLSGLYLTVGRANSQPVICTVNSTRSGCNSNNVLFTLSGANANDPNRVLQSLSDLVDSSGNLIQESGGQLYVDLEELVLQHF